MFILFSFSFPINFEHALIYYTDDGSIELGPRRLDLSCLCLNNWTCRNWICRK